MKKYLLISFGTACLLAQSTFAQTILVNSWENSTEGWGIISANWTSGGFSTTTGVTDGSYSWKLVAAASPDYGAALGGTASVGLTTLLANASSVSLSVTVPTGGDFGWYQQWDLTLNQSGGLGYSSTDNYTYSQSATIGGQATLTFTIPDSIKATLAANPTLPTSLNFQIGGGGPGTMYLDKLVITAVPEPSCLALVGLGAGALLLRRRRA